MCKIFLLVLFFSLLSVIHAVSNNFDNSERELGDICYLKDNQRGTCQEIIKCEYAKELFKSKRTSEIIHCRFKGRVPLVCCPNLEKPTKFSQALCKHKIFPNKTKIMPNHDFNHHVALGLKNPNGMVDIKCSGSLIADNLVLTAAFCANMNGLVPEVAGFMRTSYNSNDSSKNLTTTHLEHIEIEVVTIHPEYSNITKRNDIAIVKLKKPVILSEFVDTICLSSGDGNLLKEFIVIDYAIPSPNKTEKSALLLKDITQQESSENCSMFLKSMGMEFSDSQICTFSNSTSVKSLKVAGNPMIYEKDSQQFLHGITSYGVSNGLINVIVYTKINKFLDWIELEMTNIE